MDMSLLPWLRFVVSLLATAWIWCVTVGNGCVALDHWLDVIAGHGHDLMCHCWPWMCRPWPWPDVSLLAMDMMCHCGHGLDLMCHCWPWTAFDVSLLAIDLLWCIGVGCEHNLMHHCWPFNAWTAFDASLLAIDLTQCISVGHGLHLMCHCWP